MDWRSETLQLAVAAFDHLLRTEPIPFERLLPILVVPLGPVGAVDLQGVSWDEARRRPLPEPPFFYLVDRFAFLLPNRWEEFRCPIPRPETMSPGNYELCSFYRCHRDEHARKNGGEFQRALYLEAHPPRAR
ncbi:MAG: hypothetical protein AAGF12_09600 [Myxococcota bacterium]